MPQKTTERVGRAAEKTLAKSPAKQRDESNVDQAPKGEVLSTDQAIDRLERTPQHTPGS